ncbi:class IV adenylate cyclase [Nanoarchaeota archaeon]
MVDEIEVKILDINKEEIINKLKSLGAKKVFDGRISSILLDNDNGDIHKKGELLRLRKIGDDVELVYKERVEKSDIKHCIEHESKVDDFNSVLKIFHKLGYTQKSSTYEKNRISFEIDGIHFDFDEYPGINPFVEVEAHTRIDVEKGVKMLGYEMKDTKAWDAGEVAKHYGVNINKLQFKGD